MNYRSSPIPAERLEISLILNFKSPRYITHIKVKEFVTSLYLFGYRAKETEPSSSDEEEEINLLTQKSLESDSEVAQPTGKKNLLWLTNCRHRRAIVK